jgi:hypothetical protein
MNFKEQFQLRLKQYQNFLNEPRWVIISAIWMLWMLVIAVYWMSNFQDYHDLLDGPIFISHSRFDYGLFTWMIATTASTAFWPGVPLAIFCLIGSFVVFNTMKPR